MTDLSVGWIAITGYAMVQSLVFVLVFAVQRRIPAPAKWILAALSLCAGLILFEDLISMTSGYASWPHLMFTTSPLWYIIPPLLYLYLRSHYSDQSLQWHDLIHLVPFALVIYNSSAFYVFSASAKLSYLEAFVSGAFTAPEHRWNYVLFFLQAALYTGAGIRVLYGQKGKARRSRGQLFFLIGLMTIACLGLFALVASNSGNRLLIDLNSDLFVLWLAAFVLYIFVSSVRSPGTLFRLARPLQSLDQEAARHIVMQVTDYLNDEQLYLDPACSVHQIAEPLGISKNRIEQSIRQSLGMNFREFLNARRIAEAKIKLREPENRQYTIQSIAESVGFRSQATFYRVFRRLEGKTPRQFLAESE